MASRLKFESSVEVGCFMKLTNTYCLVAAGYSEATYETIEAEIGHTGVPVIPITIAGMRIIGRMCAGNSKGLIVPNSITEEEEKVLKSHLPDSVKLTKVDEKLSALGNTIVANDKVALLHPDIDDMTEAAVAETLGVEVFKTSIAGNALVGSYCTMSNQGGLVHPMCGVAELDELSTLLGVPLCAGTVNRGVDVVGTGLVANDYSAFCGIETTATELSVIEAIFKLGEKKQDFFASEERSKLFDELK